MARRRVIDPGFWDDEDVGALTNNARLLFLGCISHADCYGKLTGSPASLKKMIFGFTGTTIDEVSTLLRECDTLRGFHRYTVDGKPYIALLHWHKYQRIDHPTPSVIPDPADAKFDPAPPEVTSTKKRSEKPGSDPVSGSDSKNGSKNDSKNGSKSHSGQLREGKELREGNEVNEVRDRRNGSPRVTARKTGTDVDSVDSRLSLCILFSELNDGKPASDRDARLNRALTSRDDWDEDLAQEAMRACHENALSTNPDFEANSLSYYRKAIDRYLRADADSDGYKDRDERASKPDYNLYGLDLVNTRPLYCVFDPAKQANCYVTEQRRQEIVTDEKINLTWREAARWSEPLKDEEIR